MTEKRTMNELLAQELAKGKYRIYSMALGRVGEVLSVDNGREGTNLFPVTICLQSRPNHEVKRHRHVHGATTFNSGDVVVLQKHQGEDYLRVVNKELTK